MSAAINVEVNSQGIRGGHRVAFVHPGLKSTYQRGIYLYAKSLISGVKDAGFNTALVTDLLRHGEKQPLLRDVYEQIASPPREKIRSLQMLPRLLRHHFLSHENYQVLKAENSLAVHESNKYLVDIGNFVNVERFYEFCRLASSKPFVPPVDVDFLARTDCSTVFTTAPIAIRSRRSAVRIVQTVHDLIALNTTLHRVDRRKFGRAVEACVSHADAILAVSEYTKHELIALYPGAADHIKVVHPPIPADPATIQMSVSEDVQRSVLKKYGLESGSYMFYVGAIEERKNIVRLIKAHQQSQFAKDVVLVLAGSVEESYLKEQGIYGYFKDHQGSNTGDSKTGAVRYVGKVSELEKLCLLRQALCFVFPSLTEGFGIPVLEAQSMGCPVMTTNGSAITEVVGSSACLIQDPESVDEMIARMDELVCDGELRTRLSSEGLRNSRVFSKENFSAKLSALLNEL